MGRVFSLSTVRRLVCLFVVAAFALTLSKPVYADSFTGPCSPALPASECNALLGQYEKWVPISESTSGSCTADGSSTSLTGSDNQQRAFNYFTDEGLSPVQAAAIVGNLVVESGVNPKINQKGGGPGRGIAQWSVDDRWASLLEFAKDQDPLTLEVQLAYMSAELKGNIPSHDYSSVLTKLKEQTDVAEATGWFMGTSAASDLDPASVDFIERHGKVGGYENPGTPHLDKRIEAAKAALGLYGSVSGSDAACGSVGAVDCAGKGPAASTSGLSQLRQNVVCLAEGELALWSSGKLKPGIDFYKYSQNRDEPWCADFVSWIYNEAGYPVKDGGGWEPVAFNFEHLDKFEYHAAGSYVPSPGDVVIYNYSHVNIVASVNAESKNITVIGGNQNGDVPGSNRDSMVSKYTVSYSSGDIKGFASPKE